MVPNQGWENINKVHFKKLKLKNCPTTKSWDYFGPIENLKKKLSIFSFVGNGLHDFYPLLGTLQQN